MKCIHVGVLAAAAAALCTAAGAQTDAPPRPKSVPHPAFFASAAAANAKRMTPDQREERQFLKDAAAASRFESEASRLALTRSNDSGVRSFAVTLINHHASVVTVLQQMLQGRGMAPPMLGNDQRKTLNRLAKLHGSKFDREYMQEVGVRNQQEDVRAYERAGLVAKDAALRNWIAKTLPTLRYQLATAERMAPPDVKLANKGAPPSPASNHYEAKGGLATQFMGAAPMQLGTDMQLGPAQPVFAPALRVTPAPAVTTGH